MDAKEYIENKKNRFINSDKEILDGYAGAIDRLQKAFPRYGSFLMEFVQNADDAKSTALRIELTNNKVVISNNGVPFNESNVDSICKAGRSSKTPKDYIGYLGVGFKSIFLISDSTEIYSGDFTFKFAKNEWQDASHIPWQIIPIWLDNPTIEADEKFGTKFNISLRDTKLLNIVKDEVTPSHLNDRIILFLRRIKKIDITNPNENYARTIAKSDNISKSKEYEIYNLQEYENTNLKKEDRWLIFKASCDVPDEVKNDSMTKDWERHDVEKREVLAAFKLDNENNLVLEKEGTAHIGVFSFLPLKEIPSGLNFLIQADFLTNPGRGELARECLWNEWLAKEVSNLIINSAIQTFLKNDKWKLNFTEILYSLEGGHELFENNIKKPLRDYLEKSSIIISEDGSLAKSEEVILMNEDIKGLLNNDDFKVIYPNKKIVHKDCKPNKNLQIEKTPTEIRYFLDSEEGKKLLQYKASSKDINWFKELYSKLVKKYDYNYFYRKYARYNVEHDDFWNRMRDFPTPLMLTDEYGLAKINEAYILLKKLDIPIEVKDNFKLVHPDLVKGDGFKEFIKKINEDRYHYIPPSKKLIRELTENDIKNFINEQETLGLNPEKWRTLSDEEKFEKIKYLKKLKEQKYMDLSKFTFITIKTKSEKWIPAQDIIFSKEYLPEYNIEIIANEKKLYDLPLDYLNIEFIKNLSEDEIKKWHRFFEELGVDSKLKDKKFVKNLVQRIAVLTALKYEEGKGRLPKELTHSEETGGYDIKSQEEEIEGSGQIQSEDKFIEVKGRRQPNPDIFLTSKQYKMLKEKQDKYFVYLVKDCLRYPTLCVTRGDKLFDITDTKIIIPFDKWFKEAKEDEYQT